MKSLNSILVPIHPEGYRFLAIFAVATLLLFWLWSPLGWLGLVATSWCAYFFRDPPRVTPIGGDLLVSPADGLVVAVEPAAPPAELEMAGQSRLRISIFLSVFDCHINRVPADGEIVRLIYRPGTFQDASYADASERNERQAILLRTPGGRELGFVQIAGRIARRIICNLHEGQRVRTGERFGMIRFGSRMDVYLDEAYLPLVSVGQRAVGGETVLAEAGEGRRPRAGETR